MGNLFELLGSCYTCQDEGVVFNGLSGDNFVSDFCHDCEKGSVLANDYAIWYAQNELNDYVREMENA